MRKRDFILAVLVAMVLFGSISQQVVANSSLPQTDTHPDPIEYRVFFFDNVPVERNTMVDGGNIVDASYTSCNIDKHGTSINLPD